MNEKLHPAMREIAKKADRLLDEHRASMPRFGTIALGSSYYSPFIRGDALLEILRCLRLGATIESSAKAAKEHARTCIRNWNAKPRAASVNGKHELAFWEGHADDDIDWAVRVLSEADR